MQWKKKTVPNLFPYSLTHKPPEIITAIQNYKWESAIMNPWHKNKNKKRLSDDSHTWCPHHRPDSSHLGHLQPFVQWALHYPCGNRCLHWSSLSSPPTFPLVPSQSVLIPLGLSVLSPHPSPVSHFAFSFFFLHVLYCFLLKTIGT